MAFFDFLFGKKITIYDDFFGRMLFIQFKNKPQKNYFECKRDFKPSGRPIEVFIDADASGPTSTQKDFFRQIENEYGNLTVKIAPLIEKEFRNWKSNFKITDFRKEFQPINLALPRCEGKPVIWEIAFETEHDLNHEITITMYDFEPRDILIDG